MTTSAARLARDSTLATLGLAIQGLARFVYTIIVARFFGAHAFGVIGALLAVGVFATLFWPTGAGLVSARLRARLRSGHDEAPEVREVGRQFLRSLIALTPIVIAIAWAIAEEPILAFSAGLVFVGYAGYIFNRSSLLGAGFMRRVLVMDCTAALVALAGIALIVLADDARFALLPLGVGYLGAFGVGWMKLPRAAAADPPGRLAARAVSSNVLAQISSGGLICLAMLSAEYFGDRNTAALFAAAYALATPASMLGQSLQQVLIPYFSTSSSKSQATVRRHENRIVLAASGALVLVFLFAIFAAPYIIEILYGAAYLPATTQMQAMLGAVLVYSVSLVPAAALIALGDPKEFAKAALYGLIAGAALMVGFGPSLGTWAAVLGYAVGSMMTTVWTGVAFYRRTSA